MLRTKIIATLGPATGTKKSLKKLIKAGVNIARFNFSHGTHESHSQLLHKLQSASTNIQRPVSLLADLQGPKIRVGEFESNGIFLKKNQKIIVTTKKVMGNDNIIPITYDRLHEELKNGDRILLDDGLIELVVEHLTYRDIFCRVRVGGLLSSRKGANLPNTELKLPGLTDKDKNDLKFALKHRFDFIALSFVRKAEDIFELKKEIQRLKGSGFVIAKIEKPEAWQNIDEIIKAADGIMVARGDMGVEIGTEKVPIIQKEIVRRSIAANKPVIIATQMLESMKDNPRPTRAESSDVANAIFDGADAVMLSAETSIGNYPVESVKMMARIIRQAERNYLATQKFEEFHFSKKISFPDAISDAACKTALELKAKAIIAFTKSGFTAKLISKYRPKTEILAFTPEAKIKNQLAVYWGIEAKLFPEINNVDDMIQTVEEKLIDEKIVRPGDIIAILAGVPVGISGITNMLTLHRIRK